MDEFFLEKASDQELRRPPRLSTKNCVVPTVHDDAVLVLRTASYDAVLSLRTASS